MIFQFALLGIGSFAGTSVIFDNTYATHVNQQILTSHVGTSEGQSPASFAPAASKS